MLQTASASVEHVLPTELQVRHCRATVAKYDSKVFRTNNAWELEDKIAAKRQELGRGTSKK